MNLTPEQQQHCAKRLTITDTEERERYDAEHDIDMTVLWHYKRDYTTTMTRAGKRKARARVLAKQANQCALCSADIATGSRYCLDKTGKVVCGRCSRSLAMWRKLRADGVSEANMVAFDE